jgi:2-polyprenyl-3-methyl-5-hydroxy-6-metoxy-1,4-benzoquinol methylase
LGVLRTDGIRNEDVTRLTHGDGAFDLVVTNGVLEHVPWYHDAHGQLVRVLAPEGLFYHGDPVNQGVFFAVKDIAR